MRFVRRCRPGLGALALCGALVLVGCAAQPTSKPPPSTSAATDAPAFASDEAALAAATEAYAGYLAASDASGDPAARDAFFALSVGTVHDGDMSASQLFDERGWRQIGTTTFDSMRVQSVSQDAEGRSEVRTYLCLDVSKNDVVDASGSSVADANRPLRLPLEVLFREGAAAERKLLISESQVWSGSDFC